jgi:hypothetical protein
MILSLVENKRLLEFNSYKIYGLIDEEIWNIKRRQFWLYDLWMESSWSLVSNGSNTKSIQIPSRLKFPTESYNYFSGQGSAEIAVV